MSGLDHDQAVGHQPPAGGVADGGSAGSGAPESGALESGAAQVTPGAARRGSLEFHAAVKPDEEALVEGDRRLTWRAWNDAADSIAEGLIRLGAAPGDVVAIRTRVRLEWCLVVAAAAKISAQVLCLNWRLTPHETRFMLQASGATLVICDDEEPHLIAQAWANLALKAAVTLDVAAVGFTPFADLLAVGGAARHSATDAKLIIYTSGTTGLPKGVVIDQPSTDDQQVLADYEADLAARGHQAPGDVVFVCLPLHHGAGANTVQRATAHGNKVVLMRRFEPEEALALIERHRVSFWFTVPTLIKRLRALPDAALARYDPSSMRVVLIGSAPVTGELKVWLVTYFGPCVTEAYGSTETGLVTGLPPDQQRHRPESSGQPYRHVGISVRNEDGAELPAGQVGEIWVRTPVLFAGYLGSSPPGPELMDSAGFFRTGDAGYADAEGFLFITDRIKDMIISGGVNIYPAEIEAALGAHPAVQDAAIVGVPNAEFGEEVAGFVEMKPGQHASIDDLLAFCENRLASYKRPRTLTIVEQLPRNTMGKLLKRTLREPFWRNQARGV